MATVVAGPGPRSAFVALSCRVPTGRRSSTKAIPAPSVAAAGWSIFSPRVIATWGCTAIPASVVLASPGIPITPGGSPAIRRRAPARRQCLLGSFQSPTQQRLPNWPCVPGGEEFDQAALAPLRTYLHIVTVASSRHCRPRAVLPRRSTRPQTEAKVYKITKKHKPAM